MLGAPLGPVGASAPEDSVLRFTHEAAEALGVPEVIDLPELRHAFNMWSASLDADSALNPAPIRAVASGEYDPLVSRALWSTWAVVSTLLQFALLPFYVAAALLWPAGDGSDRIVPNWATRQLQEHQVRASLSWHVHDLALSGLSAIEPWPSVCCGRGHAALQRKVVQLRQRLADILGDDGVLLMPVMPTVAPPHDLPLLWLPNAAYGMLWNATHMPVTVCPAARKCPRTNMPVCVAIIAPHGKDHLSIAAACMLEAQGVCKWPAPPIAGVVDT
jgi:hypothetical protein